MFLLVCFVLVCGCGTVPVPPGPNFNDIQYLHSINLTNSNGTLEGLDSIDSFTDVDPQMAASLKDAIHQALNVTSPPSSVSTTPQPSTSNITNARVKREDVTSTVSPNTTTASSLTTSTQPYGTDEEFYARTDLVHFQVNIDNAEGSGA